MPSPTAIFKAAEARLPGLAALGATAWAAASVADPFGRPFLGGALALAAAVCLGAQPPRPGRLPGHWTAGPGGVLLLGHRRQGRAGEGVGIPWGALDAGLVVVGPMSARFELLAGIALQSAAAGRATVVLGPEAGWGRDGSILAAAGREAGLGGDFWLVGGSGRGARLDPFPGLGDDAVAGLIAGASPAYDGEAPASVQARLLLPAAAALHGHAVRQGLVDGTVDGFEWHLRLRNFSSAADLYENLPEEVVREIRRYTDSLPGHVEHGKQPAAVLAAHAAAEAVLRDGLAVIRRLAMGRGPALAGIDLVAPGRCSVFPYPTGGREAAVAADLVAASMASRRGARPIVVVDGLDALPEAAAARIVALVHAGAVLVAGVSQAGPAADSARGFVAGPAWRIDLPHDKALQAVLSGPGTASERFHALPLAGRGLRRKDADEARVSVPRPEPAPETGSAFAETLSRLVSEKPVEPARTPMPDEFGGKFPVPGDQDPDRAAASLLARLGASRDRAVRPGPRGREEEAVRPERDPPRMRWDAPDDPGILFDFGDFALELDRDDGDFDPLSSLGMDGEGEVSASDPGGTVPRTRIVFPSDLRDDPGLADGPWHRVAGTPLPLAASRQGRSGKAALDLEFPHLARVTARLLGGIAEGVPAAPGPLLLQGPGGIGKTRYARRLCEELSLQWSVYPCGGVADASFIGAARQWAGARPGYVPALAARRRVADPAVILDGLDAAGDGRGNGSLLDGLPNLLDPETSRRFHDPYLDRQVDLSRVVWIATAVDAARLPPGLVDHFQVETLPPPGPEHVRALAGVILADLAEEDPTREPDLGSIVGTVAPLWPGGSIRGLRRVVREARARILTEWKER